MSQKEKPPHQGHAEPKKFPPRVRNRRPRLPGTITFRGAVGRQRRGSVKSCCHLHHEVAIFQEKHEVKAIIGIAKGEAAAVTIFITEFGVARPALLPRVC